MLMIDSEHDIDLSTAAASSILPFSKMQALGNDFIVVGQDNLERALSALKLKITEQSEKECLVSLARKVCERRFGVGADGFIVVRRKAGSKNLGWTYLNNDGSASLMCGNGLRCLALWAVQNNWVSGERFYVETGKGPVEIVYASPDSITTDLGEPVLLPQLIPVQVTSDSPVVAYKFQIGNDSFKISCVSMGNPHCVIFVESDPDRLMMERLATSLQTNDFFPEGVNVEFARVISKNHVRVVVYERGCGRTLACASGAAAVTVAGFLEGRTGRDLGIELEGGLLAVNYSLQDNHLRISGPARLVYEGQINLGSLNPEAQTC